MPTCSFCKKNYESPRGLSVFLNDGKTTYFCSSKCKRNMNLKRDPRKVNWVKREKKEKGKKQVSEEKIVQIKETEEKKEEKKKIENPEEKKK